MKDAFTDKIIKRMEQIGVDLSDLPDDAWMKFLYEGWQLRVDWYEVYSVPKKRIHLTSPTGEDYYWPSP